MKKIIAILIFVLPLAATQAQTHQELDVQLGSGISYFNYNASQGSSGVGVNMLGGVGYSYYFTPQWGIGTGIQASLLNGRYKLGNSGKESYMAHDGEKDFDFRYSLQNFKEKQQVVMLEIPVMGLFNVSIEKDAQFYAALGAKIGFPLSNKNSRSAGHLEAQGYDDHNSLTLYHPEFIGFGSFDNLSTKERMRVSPVLVSAAVEAGVRFTLSEVMGFSAGLYCDYVLNNLYKKTDGKGHLIEYAKQQNGVYKPESVYGTPLSKKVMPLEAGVKFALFFMWNE